VRFIEEYTKEEKSEIAEEPENAPEEGKNRKESLR
jgi:hypothetical protein